MTWYGWMVCSIKCRVVRSLYVNNRSSIYFVGNSIAFLPINQGSYSKLHLLPTLFCCTYFNCLLCESEGCLKLGVKFSEKKVYGLLFADDFVELPETGPMLQSMIDIVYNYTKCNYVGNLKPG